MPIGIVFDANLNADKIYMDLTYQRDPIEHKFYLTVRNQSMSGLYFKLVCNIPNWTIASPTDGKLGLVGAASSKTFEIIMTRPKPTSDVEDNGTLIIEAYSDSGYTVKEGEQSLPVTVYIEDLENWTDVEIYSFDDGTDQGWTLTNLAVSNARSIEPGGYSLYKWVKDPVHRTAEKTLTLPNRNKVRISFYFMYSGLAYGWINDIAVIVNGTDKVFSIPIKVDIPSETGGWFKVAADLSAYRGQTVTVKIDIYANYCYIGIDRIVIAGKD